jgi:hypothetical protein
MPCIRPIACAITLVTLVGATSNASARTFDCAAVAAALGDSVQDLTCVASADLTTQNPATTPADNSRAGLPPLAFTPQTDRAAISPDAPNRTPITRAVPGLQVAGAMADDAGSRFVIRIPTSGFTGRLIVGVPGATRSEYTGDFAISDYVVQRGDAYVMTNKGALNVRPTDASDPLGCALAPPGHPAENLRVHFYVLDAGLEGFERWWFRTAEATDLAAAAVSAIHGSPPRRTYLFGISAGGWTVRRLLATMPERFDGGVDWEGLFVTPHHPTVVRQYPQAVAAFMDYRASGYDPSSDGAQRLLDLTFAPDIRAQPPTPLNTSSPSVGSYWETAANSQWNLLACLAIKGVDPTYAGDIASYDFAARRAESQELRRQLDHALARIATPGEIKRPLLTVSGTIEQLAPIDAHARAFRHAVVRAGRGRQHRLYEIQNGGHLDRLRDSGFNFTQLEYLAPHAQHALRLLEDWVERHIPPPDGQCVPRGGTIARAPRNDARPTHCRALIAP